jgi:hypothetical protein
MQYVEFIKQGNDLLVKLLPAGRELITEAQADEKNTDADDFMAELFEHQLCNGWLPVPPEDIGALTSAPLFSDEFEMDEDGKLKNVGKVYWFPNYAVESPVATLFEKGEVVFTGAEGTD